MTLHDLSHRIRDQFRANPTEFDTADVEALLRDELPAILAPALWTPTSFPMFHAALLDTLKRRLGDPQAVP